MPHETAKEKKEINPNPKCPNKKASIIPHKRAKTEMETFRKLFLVFNHMVNMRICMYSLCRARHVYFFCKNLCRAHFTARCTRTDLSIVCLTKCSMKANSAECCNPNRAEPTGLISVKMTFILKGCCLFL